MRSLRTQLVLISTLITGVALGGFGALSWYLLEKAEREAIDLELQAISTRFMRDLHPRVDFDEVVDEIEDLFGGKMADDNLLLSARDEWGDVGIYNADFDFGSFAEKAPPDFPPEAPETRPRPEWAFMKGAPRPEPPPLPGDGYGPAEEDPSYPGDSPKGTGAKRPMGPPGEGPKGGKRGTPGEGGRDRITEFATVVSHGKEWRMLASHERGYSVLAGLKIATTDASLAPVKRGILIGIPIALAVVALSGWLVAERALRPIRKITATASNITTRDLSERIPRNRKTDPDISRLTDVLNGMMDRLESGFSHASRFSSDVSHELKTPISIIQAEIQTGLNECEPGTAEENRLLVLREETDRLKAITRSLMLLSQADAGEMIRREEAVNLSHELEALADDAEIMAESAGVRIESEIAGGAEIKGDATLLRHALLNLINNAIKYNVEGGLVRIFLTTESGYIRIAVENTGPGIPVEDRAKVFDRFYRADRSRKRGVGGFGLGLSLARAVIEGHGGRLDLADSNEGLTRFEAGFWQEKVASKQG